MQIKNFPYVTLFLGVMFMLVVTIGGQINEASNNTRLPLLTLLIVSEFAFFLTAAGAIVSIKHMFARGTNTKLIVAALLCILSALTFLAKGISFWPS